jgi:hypothetical protein
MRPPATPTSATGFPDSTEGNPRFSMISFVIAHKLPWYSGVASTTAEHPSIAARNR